MVDQQSRGATKQRSSAAGGFGDLHSNGIPVGRDRYLENVTLTTAEVALTSTAAASSSAAVAGGRRDHPPRATLTSELCPHLASRVDEVGKA